MTAPLRYSEIVIVTILLLYHVARKCCQAQSYNKDKQINQKTCPSTPSSENDSKMRAYFHKDVSRFSLACRDTPLQTVCCLFWHFPFSFWPPSLLSNRHLSCHRPFTPPLPNRLWPNKVIDYPHEVPGKSWCLRWQQSNNIYFVRLLLLCQKLANVLQDGSRVMIYWLITNLIFWQKLAFGCLPN